MKKEGGAHKGYDAFCKAGLPQRFCLYAHRRLKGTFTSPTAPDGDLAWKMICPLPEKPEPQTAARIPGSAATPLLHSRRLGGLRYPRNMPGNLRSHLRRKNLEKCNGRNPPGAPPLDWEQPDTVERRADGNQWDRRLFQHHGSVPGSAKPS